MIRWTRPRPLRARCVAAGSAASAKREPSSGTTIVRNIGSFRQRCRRDVPVPPCLRAVQGGESLSPSPLDEADPCQADQPGRQERHGAGFRGDDVERYADPLAGTEARRPNLFRGRGVPLLGLIREIDIQTGPAARRVDWNVPIPGYLLEDDAPA